MKIIVGFITLMVYASLAQNLLAEPDINSEFGFKASFPSTPKQLMGITSRLYENMTETCFVAINEKKEFFIVTIHDYRKYASQSDSKIKIINFAVNNCVLKNPKEYERLSILNITAQTVLSGGRSALIIQKKGTIWVKSRFRIVNTLKYEVSCRMRMAHYTQEAF